jgi:hypothetical protein
MKIQLTESNSKIIKKVNQPCLMPIRVKGGKYIFMRRLIARVRFLFLFFYESKVDVGAIFN